jgi:Ni/Co efflux regulator RcnB
MHPIQHAALAALIAAVAAGPAFAGNGHGNGHGKHGGKHAEKHQVEKHHDRHGDRHAYSDDRDYRSAGCPPGLARKNNGCMPPGQAKKLAIGQPLPPGAVYTIPRHVRTQLPPPPAGYRYAVVNNQVVLVSSGNLVVDILRNLLG